MLSYTLNKYTAFLEKGWGSGKGKNLFSRKEVFPFPKNKLPLSGKACFENIRLKVFFLHSIAPPANEIAAASKKN